MRRQERAEAVANVPTSIVFSMLQELSIRNLITQDRSTPQLSLIMEALSFCHSFIHSFTHSFIHLFKTESLVTQAGLELDF